VANLVPKRFYIGPVGNGSNVYTLTSNVGSYAIVKSIVITNTTMGSTVGSVSVNLIPSGDTSSSNNAVLYSVDVPVGDVVTSDAILVMEPGDSISSIGYANSECTISIYGVEYDAG